VVNKVDRLILELCLTPAEAYERLQAIIAHVNMIVSSFHSEKYISGGWHRRGLVAAECHTRGLVGARVFCCTVGWCAGVQEGLPQANASMHPRPANPTSPPSLNHFQFIPAAEADAVLAYEEAKADGAAQRWANKITARPSACAGRPLAHPQLCTPL